VKITFKIIGSILMAAIIVSSDATISFAAPKTERRTFDRAHGETPSKLPVPRFVSLKNSVVNGRSGPDMAYPTRFVYRQRGLPVKVIAETENWRRIEDPDGGRVWVHKINLESRRTVLVRGGGALVLMRRSPDLSSRVEARLAEGVIGEIIDTRPAWRKIRTGRFIGWVQISQLWGY